MTDISRLSGITTEEIEGLRNQGIKTLEDLWLWIGKDFDEGSDRLAKETKIDSQRLIGLLADQSIREAEQESNSWPSRHLSLVAWLVSLILLGVVVGCVLQVLLPLLGPRSSVVVAAHDLEPSQALRPGDLYSAPLLWNVNYFTATHELEGLMLTRSVARGKPIRFQDVLRPQAIAARDIDAGAIVAIDAISVTWSPYQPGAVIRKDQIVGHRVRHAFRKGEVVLSEFVDSKPASVQRLTPRTIAAISFLTMSPEAMLPRGRGSPWPSSQRRT